MIILDKDEKTKLINFFRKTKKLYFYSEQGSKHKGELSFYLHSNSYYQICFQDTKNEPLFRICVNWITKISQGINSEAFLKCNRKWFNKNKPNIYDNCFVIYLEANCFNYEAEGAFSFEVEQTEDLQVILDHINLLIKGMSSFPRTDTDVNPKNQ